MLVRVFPAPKSADGLSVLSREDFPPEEWVKLQLDVPAPPYSKKAYCGKLEGYLVVVVVVVIVVVVLGTLINSPTTPPSISPLVSAP